MNETKIHTQNWKEKVEFLRIKVKRKELHVFDTPKTSWGGGTKRKRIQTISYLKSSSKRTELQK